MKPTIIAIVLACLTLNADALAQRDFTTVEIKATEVVPGLFMLEGAGGNIGVSVGPDGVFMIDDQFAPLSEKIEAAIANLTPTPVRFVVNTHWHGDHTGGNEPFRQAGAIIVAHDNVRKRLVEGLKGSRGDTPPAPADALPVITFSEEVGFHWNGHEIDVRHAAAAHTDGDAIIRFKEANVMHLGDLFFSGTYPFIDLDSGGGLDGYIAAQEAALSLADDQTRIIPGHGPLSGRSELEASIRMLKDVRARVGALVDKGLSEEGAVKAKPLKDLDPEWSWRFIDGEAMTRAAYRSLKKS